MRLLPRIGIWIPLELSFVIWTCGGTWKVSGSELGHAASWLDVENYMVSLKDAIFSTLGLSNY